MITDDSANVAAIPNIASPVPPTVFKVSFIPPPDTLPIIDLGPFARVSVILINIGVNIRNKPATASADSI